MTTSSIPVTICAALAGVLVLGTPIAVRAQAVPDSGQIAAGAEIGLFLPSDDQLSGSFTGAGLVELYITPRVAVRAKLSALNAEYDRDANQEERQARLGGDIIYNWEAGRIHPFAGGGVGIHFLRYYDHGNNIEPNDTRFGVDVLGGLDYFLNTNWTLKTEAGYQWVDDRPATNPDGFTLTFGVKRYF